MSGFKKFKLLSFIDMWNKNKSKVRIPEFDVAET